VFENSKLLPKLPLFFTVVLLGCAKKNGIVAPQGKIIFDDFNYENSSDIALTYFGWTVRNGNGGLLEMEHRQYRIC